jgi:HlyD family secretion protein
MDKVIEKKKWTGRKIITASGVCAVTLLITGSYYFTAGKARLKVDPERLTISEVTKGPFREFIPVNGIVLPQTTIYLDALEGGRVEETFAEEGAVLTKGDPILKLSNTDLELNLVNQETSVFNLLTQMQISRNAARQNTIMKLNQGTDVENALKEAERVYILNKKLFEQNAISGQEFLQCENAYNYAIKKRKLTEEILEQDSISTRQEFEQSQESYKRMQEALRIMRKKVGDLIVRAPVDGKLISLEAEIGQSKTKGESLGQLDALKGFKVRAEIDEHYISRIYTDLQGEFTFSGKDYKLKIQKVYTQVSNGKFQVDMIFLNEIPKEIRRGQTLQVKLALSDETQALLLPKGGFFQQTGGNWVFKLNNQGTAAYKVNVQLSRQNPDYYEVTHGLIPGDKIITSGYENYEQAAELVLKKE